MTALRIIVSGLVQGVFFRAETKKKADDLRLTGWVRNCDNGSVEIHAEGPDDCLRQLEQWCHHGPPAAKVSDVTVTKITPENASSFEIRR